MQTVVFKPIQLLFSVNIKNVKQQKKKNYVLIVYKHCKRRAGENPIYVWFRFMYSQK
jgi:hypothetical protein